MTICVGLFYLSNKKNEMYKEENLFFFFLVRGATGIYFFEIYFPTGIIYLLRIYYLYQDFLAPSAAPIFALTRTRVDALTRSLDDMWDLFQNVQRFFNKSR
jgi:hypothetical protein